ncbi:MAG: hypothetical protein C0513_09070, partial [Isosphaera sp.]|nr:hypothetical protein [Isosphaera sp.]
VGGFGMVGGIGGFGGVLAVTALACAALGQTTAALTPPVLDRWNYPFNSSPSNRTSAPAFFAGLAGFDDRDAQWLVGFDTTSVAAPGAPASSYAVSRVALRALVVNDFFGAGSDPNNTFRYDPTQDSWVTALAATDPAFVPDSDPGRAIELFAVGYRGNAPGTGTPWSAANYVQSSPFSTTPAVVPPAQGARAALPIDFGGVGGAARDVSNNVGGIDCALASLAAESLTAGTADAAEPRALGPGSPELVFEVDRSDRAASDGGGIGGGIPCATGRFEARPLAVGLTGQVRPGELVPAFTEFTFEIDLSDPAARAYVQQGLSVGRLNFMVTSLDLAFGGPGGSAGGTNYPVFATRFFGEPEAGILEITVGAASLLDVADSLGLTVADGGGPDGVVDGNDLVAFLGGWISGAVEVADIADFLGLTAHEGGGPDGFVDDSDIAAFLNALIVHGE